MITDPKYLGLSKREHFAGLAMQSVISNWSHLKKTEIISESIEYADALLEALDNEGEL